MPNRYFWVGMSIVVIWLAVLFVGLYGPADFRAENGDGDRTEVPVVWGMAVFAMLSTMVLAWRGFRE